MKLFFTNVYKPYKFFILYISPKCAQGKSMLPIPTYQLLTKNQTVWKQWYHSWQLHILSKALSPPLFLSNAPWKCMGLLLFCSVTNTGTGCFVDVHHLWTSCVCIAFYQSDVNRKPIKIWMLRRYLGLWSKLGRHASSLSLIALALSLSLKCSKCFNVMFPLLLTCYDRATSLLWLCCIHKHFL